MTTATGLEVAQDVLQRHEREEELATVQLLVNRAGHGGLACSVSRQPSKQSIPPASTSW